MEIPAETDIGRLLDVTSAAPADALVKLEYQSGLVEWLRPEQFVAHDSSRGAAEWELKGIHLLGIRPMGSLAEETAETVVHHFESSLNTGLFRVQADGTFGERIDGALAGDAGTWLVFIHGTASSTQASFGGFWNPPTTEWESLVKTYGGRILALEHRTFSVSPAQNALDLARLLPEKSAIHLVTHSRGGLVGELLGLGALTDEDLKPFEGRPDAEVLKELREVLGSKQINIAKFVRTACPAAGTILASNRLDLYLNLILNLLGLIPGLSENPAYEVVKATALELIKLRADPAKIPGIEAQMPESPLIHLLNTRGRFSSADLGVIAGSFKGDGVWGALKAYAARAYYWEDNDFVVNTKSMCGGMERQKGVWQFRDEGEDVNHFSYFRNARTRAHMVEWLAAPAAQPVADFARVRGVERVARRGAVQLPLVFLVPDVFGTHIRDGHGNVWLDYDALARGRFRELAGAGLRAGSIHEIYRPVHDRLALTYDVVPFPYDWREAVTDSAARLAEAVEAELAGGARPVQFAAHGMGERVVREMARLNPERWRGWCGETDAVLRIGTPPRGDHGGRDRRLVRMLALLGRQPVDEVAAILRGFPGLRDLSEGEQECHGGVEEAVLFPSESGLTGAAIEIEEARPVQAGRALRVRVCHGHLREASYPLAAGHYAGDGIVSAEAQLDGQLGGRLSARFHMDLYPGPAGTAEVVCGADTHPPGALIVGLGEVGEITPERVRRGVFDVSLRYALMRAEAMDGKAEEPRSAAFSSLLIGASGGRAIGISESVTAVVRAALDANRALRRRGLSGQVYIDEVEFIEIYEDAALEAADAVERLGERLQSDLEPDERIECGGGLRVVPGGLERQPRNDYGAGWWRRIQICAGTDGLMFEALTDRARAEQTLAANQTELIDSLLADATGEPAYDDVSGVALFELLVPNALKDQANEEANLVLVVDAAAARYPWELMAVRRRDRITPLALRSGMMRQLKTAVFRGGPRGARGLNVFVAGDTVSDLPELPGAQKEALAVAGVIQEHGYEVNPLIRQQPLTIVRELFARDYRIVHLAGHGMYQADDPARSGMVLGKGVYLTPLELRQIRNLPELVFINCCFLGTIDRQLRVSQPHRMAASVAQELIEMGVKAVVAAGWAVDDSGAAVFAQTFYREMLGGAKFGESVLTARQATRALGANNTWGAYQCYGNPDFVLHTVQRTVPS